MQGWTASVLMVQWVCWWGSGRADEAMNMFMKQLVCWCCSECVDWEVGVLIRQWVCWWISGCVDEPMGLLMRQWMCSWGSGCVGGGKTMTFTGTDRLPTCTVTPSSRRFLPQLLSATPFLNLTTGHNCHRLVYTQTHPHKPSHMLKPPHTPYLALSLSVFASHSQQILNNNRIIIDFCWW